MGISFHRRKGLAFVDLNAPYVITKKVTRNSKWECGAIEWNPHLSHANIFANAVSSFAQNFLMDSYCFDHYNFVLESKQLTYLPTCLPFFAVKPKDRDLVLERWQWFTTTNSQRSHKINKVILKIKILAVIALRTSHVFSNHFFGYYHVEVPGNTHWRVQNEASFVHTHFSIIYECRKKQCLSFSGLSLTFENSWEIENINCSGEFELSFQSVTIEILQNEVRAQALRTFCFKQKWYECLTIIKNFLIRGLT